LALLAVGAALSLSANPHCSFAVIPVLQP
jgi:hypothetical protein